MLILARYLEETILIGDARVTILAIARQKNGRMRVKLGIEAPPEIPILRSELSRLKRDGEDTTSTHLEAPLQNHVLAISADFQDETGKHTDFPEN